MCLVVFKGDVCSRTKPLYRRLNLQGRPPPSAGVRYAGGGLWGHHLHLHISQTMLDARRRQLVCDTLEEDCVDVAYTSAVQDTRQTTFPRKQGSMSTARPTHKILSPPCRATFSWVWTAQQRGYQGTPGCGAIILLVIGLVYVLAGRMGA